MFKHLLSGLLYILAFAAFASPIDGRTEAPCPHDAFVLLTIGQSNGANNAEGQVDPQNPRALNFYNGRCYLAKDPLLGATGQKGSVWTVVSARIAETGKTVIVVPASVGGSTVERWAYGKENAKLRKVFAQLQRANIAPTLILWHQGETDMLSKTTTQDYIERFGEVAKTIRLYSSAPIIVAIASKCGRAYGPAIRKAQQQLPKVYEGVSLGPDTDTLGAEYRPDGCHMLAEPHARLWLEQLTH